MATDNKSKEFFDNFRSFFHSFDKRRITFLYLIVQAISLVQNVNLVKIACALCTDIETESNYRRIQRFMAQVRLDKVLLAKFLIRLSGISGPYTLLIDRTNWQFGQSKINYLMISIKGDGWSIPIIWSLLPKAGNSSIQERIDLLNRLLEVIPADQIYNLIGDREFIGTRWFRYLVKNKIPFDMRIRENFKVEYRNKKIRISELFKRLKINEIRTLKKMIQINGTYVGVQGSKIRNSKNHKEEYLIIASYCDEQNAIERYGERWYIESMFKDLKSNGFQLQNTHLTIPERLDTLMCILAIAYTWMIKIGIWTSNVKKKIIRLKKHGRKSKSIFRLGFDTFYRHIAIRDYHHQRIYLRFLSCT